MEEGFIGVSTDWESVSTVSVSFRFCDNEESGFWKLVDTWLTRLEEYGK